ncbi:peroxiredoxin [Geodermatophilus sp. URMC 61]|uniref:peroxiredoxin n=1 Tax=Geodermatophilus sp. URMC 61 TaxID=3423411 RepID=UPI00406C53FE
MPTADGDEVSSEALRGSRAVLYSYPAAMTPGCTTQACDLRDDLGSLRGAGYAVYGISPDDPRTLAQFREQEALTFALLADRDHAVCEAYGAWGRSRWTAGRRPVSSVRPSSSTRRAGWRWRCTTSRPSVTWPNCAGPSLRHDLADELRTSPTTGAPTGARAEHGKDRTDDPTQRRPRRRPGRPARRRRRGAPVALPG